MVFSDDWLYAAITILTWFFLFLVNSSSLSVICIRSPKDGS